MIQFHWPITPLVPISSSSEVTEHVEVADEGTRPKPHVRHVVEVREANPSGGVDAPAEHPGEARRVSVLAAAARDEKRPRDHPTQLRRATHGGHHATVVASGQRHVRQEVAIPSADMGLPPSAAGTPSRVPSTVGVDERAARDARAARDEGRHPAPRGWLVRRALLVADVLGLTIAFFVTPVGLSLPSPTITEILVFLAALPLWVVAAKLYGLYDRDEERTDHSTVDDLTGVFHLLTVGRLGSPGRCACDRPRARRDLRRLAAFWALAVVLVVDRPRVRRARSAGAPRSTSRTRSSSAPATSGSSSRASSCSTPSTGSTSSASSTRARRSAAPTSSTLPLLGSPDQLPALVRLLDVERVIIAFSRESHDETLDLIRVAQGPRRPDRHRPALLRARRPERDSPRGRGPPAGRPAAASPLALVAPPQAGDGRRARRWRRSSAWRRSSSSSRSLIKLDSRGPVFFRQVRMGHGERHVPHLQVPDDGRRRRGAEGRARAPEQAPAARRRRAMFKVAGRPAGHARRPVPAPLLARRAAAADQRPRTGRCRSSARGR